MKGSNSSLKYPYSNYRMFYVLTKYMVEFKKFFKYPLNQKALSIHSENFKLFSKISLFPLQNGLCLNIICEGIQ